MPNYFYKGRTTRGEAVEQVIEAASEDQVASQLFNSGITPIEIKLVVQKEKHKVSWSRKLGFGKPTLEELVLFSKQVGSLFKAGIPISRALKSLEQTTQNEILQEILDSSVRHLEAGKTLSSSFANYPQYFPSVFTSVLRVGESTGRLDEAFEQLAFYLERDKMIRDRIKEATRYPIFVVMFLIAAFVALNIWVIPQFAQSFQRMNLELPIYTRILIGISDFMLAYWGWLLGAAAAAILGFRQWLHTEEGRFKADQMKFEIPYIGGIIRKAVLARFCRAFALTQQAGVPLVHSLTLVAGAVSNEYIADRVKNMRTGVERGDNLTNTATATGMFTPLVIQMIAVGEETGRVDEMLVKVAEFYEEEVNYEIKFLSTQIEPALLMIIAGMVLILALGIFLPMWDMIGKVK